MKKLAYLIALALLFAPSAYARGGGGHHGGSSYRSSSSRSSSAKGTITKRSSSDVYVRGYTTKSGKYVAPHYRSAPNGTQKDNFSTKGNVNPYTGKKGTKKATH